ncbi:NADPH:quinone oxidoreductase family protein [Brevibacterium yomogidense]|uniref:PROBABLE NADPH QUINONE OXIDOREDUCTASE FADB4 (NADPH:QUINONE REDUCTASE) (ZETA-CRYSTALLIN) n=1 Tax=Brevibacterium yomogidense TaxID=946573 RepID=A0A1X6X8P8_9MICO|nr:NADPH:quinone oxidoreductase family protein [Brevibacterium yomogidense]SLM95463.1 PROBABLE NADPH QUINONE OXIDOREDUCTASE FADB4 (NADPH:QUINONE REDUCTASE) (ZETA-CRYSTALLIN) [Brevibacterium yomogidense]
MKAVQVTTLDGPDSLSVAEVEAPTPGPNEVLIDVAYAGVTYPELLQTKGLYQVKHELPFTLGSEAAGVVSAVGDGVENLAVGDRVATIAGKGGYAEVMTAPANATVKLPDSVSLSAAAGMPMNLLTADFALRVRGRLEAGQTVLVHGAAGGLGTALVQVAVAMGATVIGVVSTEEKAETVRSLGAAHAVMSDGFKDAVKELVPGGVDLVADLVGNPKDGDRFTDSLRCLATFGTVLVLGFTAGEIPQVKVNRLLLNNVGVAGVGWGAAFAKDAGLIASQWEAMWDHLVAGTLDPVIHGTFTLEQAGDAIKELETRAVRGKVLLQVKEEA